ncbi:MAG: N-acetylmuramoyl-L-alanine amidase, partial [Oscillospiraceae bacterium]|nr:N-acetylmuramoyl-L-alanine amidase [Oscillospiraceae bacterium]
MPDRGWWMAMLGLFIRLVILAAIVVAIVLIVRSCSSSQKNEEQALEPTDSAALPENEERTETAAEAKAVIVLDPGHGGNDAGAVSEDGEYDEKDITLAIADYTREILEDEYGYEVVMTRDDDTYLSLDDRVDITKESEGDIFVSIHINALEDDDEWTGIYTFYYGEGDDVLAQDIQNGIITATDGDDRGISRANYYVIVYAGMPAVLVEAGFMTTQADLDKLVDTDYQKAFARGIANGIELYLSRPEESD